MKLHSHLIQEPSRRKLIWYPRWFFKLYRGPEYGENTIVSGHIELAVSKPTGEFAISFGVGTRGSETPFDGHIKIAGTAIYWGIEQGGRWAERITQLWLNRRPNRLRAACLDDSCDCPPWQPGASTKRHAGRNGERYEDRWEGRQVNVYTYAGKLWWFLWTTKNGSDRPFAKWRHSTMHLNPLDVLFGEQRYWYDDIETADIVVQFPEAEYPVKATLQRQRFGRPKLPSRHVKSWTVDVDAPKGIPDRFDHSGGWKGDRVYGFGVALNERRKDWQIDAKAAIEANILKSRAASGFREPQKVES